MSTPHKQDVDDIEGYEDATAFNLIVTPMTDTNGRPLVKTTHVVDAFIVAAITFFSLLLGTSIPEVIMGHTSYVTPTTVQDRIWTAGLAFGLTFFAQWARYRGVLILEFLNGKDEE
jgi:hypothetical protein